MNAIATIIKPSKWVSEWTLIVVDENGENVGDLVRASTRAQLSEVVKSNGYTVLPNKEFNRQSNLRAHNARCKVDVYYAMMND